MTLRLFPERSGSDPDRPFFISENIGSDFCARRAQKSNPENIGFRQMSPGTPNARFAMTLRPSGVSVTTCDRNRFALFNFPRGARKIHSPKISASASIVARHSERVLRHDALPFLVLSATADETHSRKYRL